MGRGLLWWLASAGLALLPGLCRGDEPKLEPVTMANPVVSLSFSIGYVADELGLWAKHGLSVKTLEISGVGALNAVISGSADFAQPSGPSFTRAAAKGQRLLAIVMTTDRVSAQAVLRKGLAAGFDPKAPLAERAKFLRGRTIAVESINSVIHAYALLMAHIGGYDPADIRIAVMQPPNMIAAFDTNQIDGFVMAPPWTQIPVLAGTAVMIASGPDGDPASLAPFANTILVTRPETCEKRPSVCAAMGRSFAEAAGFIKDHPDQALALVQGRFKTLDPKLLAASYEVTRSIMPVPPAVTKAALENDERLNVEAGLMQPDETLKSYDGLYTDAYVR
jgi:NitT/TauT family transport system substrate-binding protein